MDSPEIFALQHEAAIPIGKYRMQASAFRPETALHSGVALCGNLTEKVEPQAQLHSNASGSEESDTGKPAEHRTKQQAVLNFGQKRLFSKPCSICGMVYQRGHKEDEATHAKQCRADTGMPSVSIPASCKQLSPADKEFSVFELLPEHCKSHLSSIKSVLECLQRDLGMHSVTLSNARRLYIACAARGASGSATSSVIAALLVEPISEAQRAMPLAAEECPPATSPPSPPSRAAEKGGAARHSGALRVYGSAKKRPRQEDDAQQDQGNTSLVTDPSPPRPVGVPAAPNSAPASAATSAPAAASASSSSHKPTRTLLSFFKSTSAAPSAAPAPVAVTSPPSLTHTDRPATSTMPRASVTGASGATFRVASALYPATLGVLQVWTHPSRRRQGVATTLLEVARSRAVFGQVVPKDQVAFSQPTSAGHAFASAFAGRRDHLLYA